MFLIRGSFSFSGRVLSVCADVTMTSSVSVYTRLADVVWLSGGVYPVQVSRQTGQTCHIVFVPTYTGFTKHETFIERPVINRSALSFQHNYVGYTRDKQAQESTF